MMRQRGNDDSAGRGIKHRGHRLGMLLKIASLRNLQLSTPAPALVYTFNAEENRLMLEVNEAIGFWPVGHAGCWRKGS